MNATPTKPVTAVQVAAFLRRRLPMVRTWPRERLVCWVAWFMRADRALVLTDERERICGVGLGRFVTSCAAELDRSRLMDEPAGRVLWIDAIVASRAEAIPDMLRILCAKWGARDAVAGECFSRAGELRMFPIKTINRFFGG